jgi:ClpP class serine protease
LVAVCIDFCNQQMARRIFHTILNPRTVWAIDSSYADGYKSDILNFIKGNNLGLAVENQKPQSILNLYSAGKRIDLGEEAGDRLDSETEITTSGEAVVAIISIVGPIIKYSEPCGQTGMEELNDIIEACIANPQITAIILKVDSGGGEGDAVQNISKTIKGSSKPIIGYIDSMAASACYWILSNCSEIWMGNSTDMAGSIGTYVTLPDWKGYFESQGLKIEEIYATLSTEKNKDFTDAIAGKPEGLRKNFIDPFNESFIAAVKANRPSVSQEVFTGKMYYANDAIAAGLVDGIKDFKAMIPYAISKGTAKPTANTNSTKMNMTTKFPTVASATGLTEVEASTEGVHFQESHLSALENALVAANTAKATAEANLVTANAAKAQAETDLQTEKDAHAALKATSAGATAAGEAPADDQGDKGENKVVLSESDAELAAARKASGWVPAA